VFSSDVAVTGQAPPAPKPVVAQAPVAQPPREVAAARPAAPPPAPAPEPAPAPAPVARDEPAPAALPPTGSPFPLAGLLGLLFTSAGLTVRRISRHGNR
jgi:hypothetical protein